MLESIAQLSWAERKKALVNILWLLKREENLMKQEAGSGVKEARLNNAVNAILPKFPNLLLILVEEPQLAVRFKSGFSLKLTLDRFTQTFFFCSLGL